MRFHAPRAERLVEAWNAGDTAFVLDQLSDELTLEARLPKMPTPAQSVSLRSKAAFAEGLARYRGPLPHFAIVNAMEDVHTIGLVLKDSDGDLLAVTIELDEDGRFARITSYRPDP